MSTIKYELGDATDISQMPPGPKVILHIVNDRKVWGAGFVLALSKRWKSPETLYRQTKAVLGDIQIAVVEDDVYVINMVAQTLGWGDGPPIRYEALRECLVKVKAFVKSANAMIVAPKFGSGLAGGSWDKIEQMIEDVFSDSNIPIIIYSLE